MSNSSEAALTLVLSVATFFVAATPAKSQTNHPRDPSSAVGLINNFVESVYPELLGNERYMKVSIGHSIDRPWREVYGADFEIKTFRPDVSFSPAFDRETGKQILPPENVTLLTGQIQFDDAGNVENLWVDSEITNRKQNDAIHHLIEAHPEWSDAKDYEVLKMAGALYGPADKEHFVRSLRMDRFEKPFGHLEVKSVDFDGLTHEHVGSFAMLDWRVDTDAELPDGSRARYVFTFEPFGGRFVGVQRIHHPRVTPSKEPPK
jgi:hypothetical protein